MRFRPLARNRNAHESGRRRMYRLFTFAAMLLVGVGAFATAESSMQRHSDPPLFQGYRAEGYAAISTPSRSVSMAFVMSGVVAEVPLREGSIVSPGDVLVRLDDDVQRFNVTVQRIATEDQSEVEAAEQQAKLAEFDYQNVLDLDTKGAAAPREVEQAATELALRKINVTAARRKQEQNKIVLEREEATLADMTLRSPIDGVIARVETEVGEAIEGLEPAIHVIAIDPLWMDVAIPVQLAQFVQPGSTAIVRWRDVSQDIRSEGVVLWVSPISDASSSTIVIRIEIDNPDRLPAGLHARVQFPEALDAMRRVGG